MRLASGIAPIPQECAIAGVKVGLGCGRQVPSNDSNHLLDECAYGECSSARVPRNENRRRNDRRVKQTLHRHSWRREVPFGMM